jgi:hypothetical protein
MKITMLATVAMLATLGVLSTSVSLTFASEPKRDILGLRPGMSYAEATSLAAKLCKGEIGRPPRSDGNSPTTFFNACSLGTRQVIGGANNDAEENLVFMFGNALPEQSLISVSYHFEKLQPNLDLNRYVAERFGVPSSCLSTHACLLDPPGLYLSFAQGNTNSTGLLFLIDNRLFHENEKRWKQEHSPPKLGTNGEERKSSEDLTVVFPPAAASTSSPNDNRKSHRDSLADRKAPRAAFRDSASGVPVIIREERR